TDEAPIMHMDEAIAAYPGEWVLMQILTYDEQGVPTGRILAHARSDAQLNKRLAKEPPRSEQPPDAGAYYSFKAYPRIRSGEEWRRLPDQLAGAETYVEPRL